MKKSLSILLTIILSLAVLLSLASCTQTPEEPTTNDPETYTVTFDSDGGTSVTAQSVEAGKKATEPTPPTKSGYTFLGWYLGEEKWSFVGYVITENITLTAKWEANETPATKYTVTFDSDGGTSVTAQSVEAGKKATEPTPPTKSGYTFLGWYLGEEKWSFVGYVVTENITLTAKWEVDPTIHYVTFDPDNGDPTYTIMVTEGDTIYAPTEPTMEGYKFLGWYYGTESNILEFPLEIPINYPVKFLTFTAKWEANSGSEDEEFILEDFDPTKPVTITFYHSMSRTLQDALNVSITNFKKIYPNITVEHSSYGSYGGVLSQVNTELTAGDHPDLAYCYSDHVAIYNKVGATQGLDIFINDTAYGFTLDEINNFFDGVLDEGRVFGEDETYLIPIAKSTEVLYYNKTFFNKYGLTVPTTWEEMETLLQAIKEIDPNCIPLGYDSESNLFINLAAQFGSPYTDATAENPFVFNNEANRQIVERIHTWYQNGWITTEQLSGGYTSSLFTGEFDSGTRCYMVIGSTSGATYNQPNSYSGVYAFEVGITSIPQFDVSNPKVISQNPSICIFKNEDSQKLWASWLFLKHLATDEVFQAAVCMNNGCAPVTKSVLDNPSFATFLASADKDGTINIQAYAVKVAIEQYGSFFVTDAFHGSSVAREQVGLLVQSCLAYSGNDLVEFIKSTFKKAVDTCTLQAGYPDTPDTPAEFKENTAYKLYVEQKTAGGTYYALATTQYGENKFINTTTNAAEAVDFYVEIVDGGYKFYTMVGETKTYIYAKTEVKGDKISKFIGFSTTEGSVFTYDTNLGTFFTEISGAKYGVGTYGTYTTISLSAESFFDATTVGTTQFVMKLVESDADDTPKKTEESEYFNENGELILFKDGYATFQFVVANNVVSSHRMIVDELAYTLSERSKSDIDVKFVGEESQDVEILIGVITNRGDEYIVDISEYGDKDFVVKQIGTKIVVLASTDSALDSAIQYLKERVFGVYKANNPIDDVVMSSDKNHEVQ